MCKNSMLSKHLFVSDMAQASPRLRRHAVLTGPPGVGKTTLVKKVCKVLVEEGRVVGGFFTEEVGGYI